MSMNRIDELRANHADVHKRIENACVAAGREAKDITLIAVTKTWPASDIALLAQLGITDIGENKDQEAKEKFSQLAGLGLTWHAIGQVQTNKAKSVAAWADVVHAVDRSALVEALAKTTRELPLELLIQVNLDPNPTPGRGGALPGEVLELAEQISASGNFLLGGVMAVAPLGQDPAPAFAKLQEISKSLCAKYPTATKISAGMSDDLEIAVKYGATHLRIGSSILGHRNYHG